jgi:outer membrane receptor for ferrienterochelin and colicins
MRHIRYCKVIISILLIFSFISRVSAEDELDQWLDLDIDKLIDIKVVTATKTQQHQSKVPATVRVITAHQRKKRGYRSLEDVLGDLPGFQFRNINGFNTYTFMRGAPSQNNLIIVMVDGVEINELNSGGFYGGMQYDLANVRQIEVVYGPSSVLYGTNAVSGVINILTRDPSTDSTSEINLKTGNFNSWSAQIRTGYFNASTNIGYVASGMLSQSDKAKLTEATGDYNWSESMENFEKVMSVNGKIAVKNVTLGFLVQDKQTSRTTNYKSVGTTYLDHGTLWHIRFINSFLENIHAITDKCALSSLLYYRNSTIMDNTVAYISTDSTKGQVGYFRPNDQIGLDEQLSFTPEHFLSVIGGLTFEYDRLSEAFSQSFSCDTAVPPPVPAAPELELDKLASAYTQLHLKPVELFELTTGIRLDYSTVYDFIFTPHTALVTNYRKITAKAIYSEAFRAPKPWDYTWNRGNADLKPEKIRSFEAVLSFKAINSLLLDVSLYRNVIFDKLSIDTSGDRWTNSTELITNGFECNGMYFHDYFDAFFNYSFADSRNADDIPVDEIARHCSNLGITFNMTRNVSAVLRANYTGTRPNPVFIPSIGRKRIKRYYCLDAVITISDLRGFTVQLSVDNLLDTEYYHPSNRPPARYRQPQRSFLLTIGYGF